MIRDQDFQRYFSFGGTPSSSEEERDDKVRRRDRSQPQPFQTPKELDSKGSNRRRSTPATVTQLTPSPMASPFVDNVTPNVASMMSPTPNNHIRSSSSNFVDVQKGFLDNNVSTTLFRDGTPAYSRRKSRSSGRKSRLSQSLLLHGYESPLAMERRRSSTSSHSTTHHRPSGSFGNRSLPSFGSQEFPVRDSSPDTTSRPRMGSYGGANSPGSVDSNGSSPSFVRSMKNRGKTIFCVWVFLLLSVMSTLLMILGTQSAVKPDRGYEPFRPDFHSMSAAGLRGQMTSGHWEELHKNKDTKKKKDHHHSKKDHHHSEKDHYNNYVLPQQHGSLQGEMPHSSKESRKPQKSIVIQQELPVEIVNPFRIHLPSPISKRSRKWDLEDINLYSTRSIESKRVFALDPTAMGSSLPRPRKLKPYPADFTDNTQLYSLLDSSDERLGRMEIREPYTQGECVPMQDWQTTFHPVCNSMHEVAIDGLGDDENGSDINLFGTKGFWRYAWKLDVDHVQERDTVVLKTLKYEHNFEDAHFEHDRIDAVAMERLTSSPHVINIFGFCGHSVVTEYADGSRVGELADKSKKKPLARLKIARDIANGLADVHGIDGDGNATFVHLDINPANVVSIGGTLKLNDFNIGIIRRWNTTSQTPCGFPAQYPNPQWRSPEEARNEQNLTEKVDVFSMGHIFFRLIAGHEPWNKLEPGGRPSKEEVNVKVQRGDLPYIPEEVRHSTDPEIQAIYKVMKSCYTFDPAKRPSAREIANSLNKALVGLEKMAKSVEKS